MTTPFLDSVKKKRRRKEEEKRKLEKGVSIVKTQPMLMIRPTSNASYLVQLFGL